MDIGNVLISSTPPDFLLSLSKLVDANVHSFSQSLKMVIIHGSIVKGGFIPGYSDVDIQFWLSASCFGRYGLKTKYSSFLQHELEHLSFKSWNNSPVQRHYLNYDSLPFWWTGYIKHKEDQSFAIVIGKNFFQERFLASRKTLDYSLDNSLFRLPHFIRSIRRQWGTDSKKGFPSLLRFTGATLFPLMYNLVGFKYNDPFSAWLLTKDKLLTSFEDLFPDQLFTSHARVFYQSILDWDQTIQSVSLVEKAITSALEFLIKIYAFAGTEKMLPSQEPALRE
jgi:predicted nucleotidyltransferase